MGASCLGVPLCVRAGPYPPIRARAGAISPSIHPHQSMFALEKFQPADMGCVWIALRHDLDRAPKGAAMSCARIWV